MSDLKDALNKVIVPINKEGYFIIAVSCFITFLLMLISSFLGWVAVVLTVFIIYFFRDPERVMPDGDNLILASADGIVDQIEESISAPEGLGIEKSKKFQRVSIFLSTFNVHVQRIPIDGTIEKVEYIQGKFLNIVNDKYHNDNERQLCLMKAEQGFDVIFVQIAGMVARRIVCNLKDGQKVKAGDRFGCIKFGSRVDVYLPKEVKIKVKVGQTMIGGESVIGCINKK
ncbi:MAG TPA: phosphatidylserine decarboxylase family protein [Rickettsiales bacterium]|nr:phosphatidylserine decarboxylase family protein [Rickettsiales bacterium]